MLHAAGRVLAERRGDLLAVMTAEAGKTLAEGDPEVSEAIDSKDSMHLKEELGDLLLQPVFHAAIAEEKGEFTMNEVLDAINDKLIRRHPHVFGEAVIESSDVSIRTVVDLPAPLGPRKPKTSPRRTSRSTPRTASTVPSRPV